MMQFAKTIGCAVVLLGASSTVLAAPPSQPENFSVTSKTKVPGLTLKPGSYSIRVVDELSDRVIVRVDAANGGAHTTFIGLHNGGIAKPATPGIVPWTGAGDTASYVRGWYFPGSASVVEFVYPKAEAVKIAQKTDTRVPAIDPASEGRLAPANELSKDDMELVTLWLLSSTRVGPGGGTAAIAAERYHQPAGQQVAATQDAGVRSGPATAGVSVPAQTATERTGAARVATVAPSVPTQVASVRRPKPVVAVLPHTASELPLVEVMGGLALLGGFSLRRFRGESA